MNAQLITKETYAQFVKAFKQAHYVKIAIRTTCDISPQSLSASAIAVVELEWERDGIKSTYTANFPARVDYARDDYESVAQCDYYFTMNKVELEYLFLHLCKTGDMGFKLELLQRHDGDTVATVTAWVNEKTYITAPVYKQQSDYVYSLTTTLRKEAPVTA